MRQIFVVILVSLSFSLHANEARFFGESAITPDSAQSEMIASSIDALIQDCSSATKIDSLPLIDGQGIEATYSTQPIEFDHLPAGKVTGVTKVIVKLWDNAERNYGMDIYAFSESGIYSLGKYYRLAYPIVNMIKRPMPPNASMQKDTNEAAATN